MPKFYDEEHSKLFYLTLRNIRALDFDVYRVSFVYLITLDRVCREHIRDLYNFKEHCIDPTALNQPWQTDTSIRTTRLAFNLYTGHTLWCSDEDVFFCSPADIFSCSYAPYYWEAIKLRYPEYINT